MHAARSITVPKTEEEAEKFLKEVGVSQSLTRQERLSLVTEELILQGKRVKPEGMPYSQVSEMYEYFAKEPSCLLLEYFLFYKPLSSLAKVVMKSEKGVFIQLELTQYLDHEIMIFLEPLVDKLLNFTLTFRVVRLYLRNELPMGLQGVLVQDDVVRERLVERLRARMTSAVYTSEPTEYTLALQDPSCMLISALARSALLPPVQSVDVPDLVRQERDQGLTIPAFMIESVIKRVDEVLNSDLYFNSRLVSVDRKSYSVAYYFEIAEGIVVPVLLNEYTYANFEYSLYRDLPKYFRSKIDWYYYFRTNTTLFFLGDEPGNYGDWLHIDDSEGQEFSCLYDHDKGQITLRVPPGQYGKGAQTSLSVTLTKRTDKLVKRRMKITPDYVRNYCFPWAQQHELLLCLSKVTYPDVVSVMMEIMGKIVTNQVDRSSIRTKPYQRYFIDQHNLVEEIKQGKADQWGCYLGPKCISLYCAKLTHVRLPGQRPHYLVRTLRTRLNMDKTMYILVPASAGEVHIHATIDVPGAHHARNVGELERAEPKEYSRGTLYFDPNFYSLYCLKKIGESFEGGILWITAYDKEYNLLATRAFHLKDPDDDYETLATKLRLLAYRSEKNVLSSEVFTFKDGQIYINGHFVATIDYLSLREQQMQKWRKGGIQVAPNFEQFFLAQQEFNVQRDIVGEQLPDNFPLDALD